MNDISTRLETCCRFGLTIAVIALAITASYGLVNDDYLFIRVYDLHFYGNSLPEQLVRTFAFFPSPVENLEAIARGYTQANWFTSTAIEHRFFRPLAALTHYFDYRLGSKPVLMHLHNFAYVLLSAALLSKLLKAFNLTTRQQWLIAALFFIDTASLWAGWIAQRNAYMALATLLAALLFHIRFQQTGKIGNYLIALACLALGLLCSEAAIVISVYLFFLPVAFRQPLFSGSHLLRMVPVAVICLVYLLFYRHMQFGVSNHPLYTNPMTETSAALASMFIKIPAFTLSGMGIIPAETAYLLERLASGTTVWIIFGILNLLVLGLLVKAYKFINDEYRGLFLYGVGCAAGALLPLAGSMIADRSGTFVKLGISFALGACLLQMAHGIGSARAAAFVRALPWLLLGKAGFMLMAAIAWSLFLMRPDPALQPLKAMTETPRHIVYLNVHDIFFTSYILEKIQFHHDLHVQTAHRLVADNGEVILERLDADSIVLTAARGGYLLDLFDLPMEPANFAKGQHFDAGIMEIEVLAAEKGLPQAIRVDFSLPLGNITFLGYDGKEYRPVTLPETGSITL